MIMSQFEWGRVRWSNSAFLIGTLVLASTATPIYLWWFGVSTAQVVLFLFFFAATGLSITLGYHRLYSHLSFQARWPVRLLTLLFGAAAFENSALIWAADHRRHHRFVDHQEDPYDISKGFFHAHIGWILFRYPPDTSLVWAKDLQKDRLVVWQHRYYVPLAILVGFILPTFVGWVAGGLAGRAGELPPGRSHTDRRRSPHDLFYQFALSHRGPPALFQSLHSQR
jgi:stearoyl-CoA desaturase (delta-9 desaturase)